MVNVQKSDPQNTPERKITCYTMPCNGMFKVESEQSRKFVNLLKVHCSTGKKSIYNYKVYKVKVIIKRKLR